MEVVWQKQPLSAQRFGILSHCTHVYCLDCIRKWRSAKQFENILIRSALPRLLKYLQMLLSQRFPEEDLKDWSDL